MNLEGFQIMTSKASLSTIVAVSALFGSISSVHAAPIKLLCKGPVTMAFDTETLQDPTRISVELDQAVGWVSLDDGTERIPIASSGTAVTYTRTAPAPGGVVSITNGRIELSTGRLYFDTTYSSSKGPGERWTTPFGSQVTTLRITGDLPCRRGD